METTPLGQSPPPTCSASSDTPETDAMLATDLHHMEDDDTCPVSAYWRMVNLCRKIEAERDEALRMREWDNRAISIARHYGDEDSTRDIEDGRIRPAKVLEKAVAVAIDAWVDGNAVTIQLCPEEVEQWVALVVVAGQDVTGFSLDEMCDIEREPEELWMSSAVLAALDHARRAPVKSSPNAGVLAHADENLSNQ